MSRPRFLPMLSSLLAAALASTAFAQTEAPPPLPGYQFEGPSGAQPPRSQPEIGLALSAPYALKVVGALTLVFASDAFANDPSVQFSTSGRTVDFEIPAGETQARFPNGTSLVRVQTGSVAGRILITPEFATESGDDVTPVSPQVLEMTVEQSAPVITRLAIAEKTSTRITLEITGLATSRAVSQMNLTFQGRPGENLSTTNLSLDVASPFASWFQNSQSATYGSQYTATVPLTFSGSTTNVTGTTNTVASIAVTLSNSLGSSEAVTVQNPE